MRTLLQSLLLFLCMTLLLGVFYPALVTGLSMLWPEKRAGSLLIKNEKVVGSSLLAQKFTKDQYFWPRPSASDFVAMPSSASNLSPTSAQLHEALAQRRAALAHAHQVAEHEVPEELLCASGSGLDPHILPQTALFQMKRIAKARHLSHAQEQELQALIEGAKSRPILSVLGPSVVNVLMLNMAMDEAFGTLKQ